MYFFIAEGLFLVGLVPHTPRIVHLHYSLLHDTFQSQELQTSSFWSVTPISQGSQLYLTLIHLVLFFLFQESHPLPCLKAGADQASNFVAFYSILLLKHCIHSKAPWYHMGSATSMLHLQLQSGLHLSSQQGHQIQHIKTEICSPSTLKHTLLPF